MNEGWKWQAFVQQGEPMPSLSARGLPVQDAELSWWLVQPSALGFEV